MPSRRPTRSTRRGLREVGISLCMLLAMASARAIQEPSSESAAALATSQPFELTPSVERASFELRRPTMRSLYDAIAESYGIRLLYDRDLGEPPVAGDFRLPDLTLAEALEAAGSITRTFVAPLDPRTGIVAADTPDKRAEYERQILGSFHLDSQTTPQQLTEISNALRTIVDLRRVTQDNRNNWITVLGRTRQVAVAQEFIRTLDRPAGEVMLEMEVWEIDLERARDIGIAPPQPFVLQFLGNDTARRTVPLLQWGQVQTIYGMQLPGLTAFLRDTRSLVRFHQSLQVRASDGQEARLLVGQRIPVATDRVSSVILVEDGKGNGSAAISTAGFIPGIQYFDVGVVIHATPHLHAGGEITLQLDFALRSVGATTEAGLPSFTNRQITTQVRLSNGEAFLMGGILSRAERASVSDYPWFARLPVIGLLFGRRQTADSDTELLILARPVLMRPPAADQFASRSIFFGKEMTGLPAPLPLPPTEPEAAPGEAPAEPVPPGVAPPSGQPPVPGLPGVPGQVFPPSVTPLPGQLPQGVPFPPGVVPQGVGAPPAVPLVPGQPVQPGQPPQSGAGDQTLPPGTP